MHLLPSSLSGRVTLLGATVTCALLVLMALLVDAGVRTRQSFQWVSHTQQVLQTIDEAVAGIRAAESGQRGFLVTHDPIYARSFDASILEANHDFALIRRLIADNPAQSVRAMALQEVVANKVRALRVPLMLGRQGRFDAAAAFVASGRGRALMDRMVTIANEMQGEERRLLGLRVDEADRRAGWSRLLVLLGGSGIVTALLVAIVFLVRSIRCPIEAMQRAMTAFGAGDRSARITVRMGTREFRELAGGYNRMVDQLGAAIIRLSESDSQLQQLNGELLARSQELAARGAVIELLGGMAHRMQAARTDEELGAVVSCFLPQVLPGSAGVLYAYNNSRNILARLTAWGAPHAMTDSFAPDECWALRRGQSHGVDAAGLDVVCRHVPADGVAYSCEPLLAGGEVIGMIYLEGTVQREQRFRLTMLSENIASALTNLRLQRGLREQTIRDPLTGLFNRRYMEEALAIEIARVARVEAPLSLAMCDVDHFKRFNDEFGHDAGDALLRAVAGEMAHHFREGDVVCRYGGEEFMVIAPGATPAQLAQRIETLRTAIMAIALRHEGVALGTISMSFGIAGWSPAMARDGAVLVRAADAALYDAKRAGRNRAIIADRQAA